MLRNYLAGGRKTRTHKSITQKSYLYYRLCAQYMFDLKKLNQQTYFFGPSGVEPSFRTGPHVTDFTRDGLLVYTLVFCYRFVVNSYADNFPHSLSSITRN